MLGTSNFVGFALAFQFPVVNEKEKKANPAGSSSYHWAKTSFKVVRFPLVPNLLNYHKLDFIFFALQDISAVLRDTCVRHPSLEETAQ